MGAEPQHIVVELENGNSLHYRSDPRYGFWTVNFDKGGLPPELKGRFLELQDLQRRTETYLARRVNNKTKVKDA